MRTTDYTGTEWCSQMELLPQMDQRIWIDKSRRAIFIDIEVSNTNNLCDTYVANIDKYKDLDIEIQQQWQQDSVRMVSIVTTGVVPKSSRDGLFELNIELCVMRYIQKSSNFEYL